MFKVAYKANITSLLKIITHKCLNGVAVKPGSASNLVCITGLVGNL